MTGPLEALNLQHFTYSVYHYVSESDDFLLDPPYQRQSVWSPEQRVNLIRSFLLGVPIGSVILNDRFKAGVGYHFAVVDGRQRIETVRAWFAGAVAVPTSWWTDEDLGAPRDQLGDTVTVNDLSEVAVRDCKRRWQLPAAEARLPEQAEPDLYLLVNFGGVAQTDDDRARVEALTTADHTPDAKELTR